MPEPGGPYDWSAGSAAGLLSQASAVLAREAGRLPTSLGSTAQSLPSGAPGVPDLGAVVKDFAGRVCPVTGAAVPLPGADKDRLQRQAHELVAGLLAALGQAPGYGAGSGGPMPMSPDVRNVGSGVCPVTKATVPKGPAIFDKDQLRKQAHDFIETLLITFNDTTGERGLPTDDKVPLIQCEAPVQAGGQARAILSVGNEESTPSDVTLYCTNFVADSGHELPALRVAVSPRRATIAPNGEAMFQITIAVPQQTPAGTYSGLIQAMGTKYVKAVLSLDVA
jgi:hypothetical protein